MAETPAADATKTLISDKPRESMACKILESDMDMAFNLQLQEITRSEQQQKDFKCCQLESRKNKRDLSIRLYDQKFASEILQIPNQEWEDYGDKFHKPYEVGTSEQLVDNHCFRLYCKGIVVKKLGAIGVAICDMKDNLVFQLSKPFLDEGEIRAEIVDVQALIEGFNAAIALDLKKIVYYCDDSMVHQYVSGKRQPGEHSMTNLIKSVNKLQGKFVSCSPLLVSPTDIKFAFELAKSVLSLQLTKSAGSSSNYKKAVKVVCSICYEDTDAQLMFTVTGCGHQYCIFCMKQHVEVKLHHGTLPKCPHEYCKSGINVKGCQTIMLEPKFVDIMSQLEKEKSVPASEKVYCPNPKCSALMSINEVREHSRTLVGNPEGGASKCIKCQGLFCLNCKSSWHSSMSCSDYRQSRSFSNNEDTKLKSLAAKKRWRQCPRCSNMIELAEGCYHMICRCGHSFCYTCGAEWKKKNPTCSCKLWDEYYIRNHGDGRRRRQRRE